MTKNSLQIRAANAAKGEDMRGEIALIEMRRHYHCAAYNALIAVISCTQTDLKFYRGFLFQEDSAKVQKILVNHSLFLSMMGFLTLLRYDICF